MDKWPLQAAAADSSRLIQDISNCFRTLAVTIRLVLLQTAYNLYHNDITKVVILGIEYRYRSLSSIEVSSIDVMAGIILTLIAFHILVMSGDFKFGR